MHQTLRIATRKSALALWQAHYVKQQLEWFHPALTVELLPITSRGDKILDVPLAKIGGKGLFVKELEHALLNYEADIAVHSMKDVPMTFPDGLCLSSICRREDPRDAFVSRHYQKLVDLPQGAKVGTSSLRRQSQLLAIRPDLDIAFLRGNVNTRLVKLDQGDYDAIILAAAGLMRLEMTERISSFIDVEQCLPAGGQGAVGIECRSEDPVTQTLLAPLNHPETALAVQAERAMNRRLQGGCQVPIASYAIQHHQRLWLRGLVAEPDGHRVLAEEIIGDDPEQMGITLAERLLARGAGVILERVYNDSPDENATHEH